MQNNCRRANANDIEAIAGLEKACFEIPWSRKSIEEQLNSEFSRFFVAESDGRVIAYIGSRFLLEECEIFNIATAPEHRNRGVAARLAAYFISEIEAEGGRSFSLEVRPGNIPALALYCKLGFKEEGRRKGYYTDGEDAIIMWRRNDK